MTRRLAIKRLTKSDLTLFEWHHKHGEAGNQKAINLNANVFVDLLYPRLARPELGHSQGFPVRLDLLGPGGAAALPLARKIIKGKSYKNWRLNGEFISDPEQDPDRFRVLGPGDLALLDFEGEETPVAIRILLLASRTEVDSPILKALSPLVAAQSMAEVTSSDIEGVLRRASTPEDHAVQSFLLDEALEEAVLGDVDGVRRVRRTTRAVSKDDLVLARKRIDEVGYSGEVLVNAFLASQLDAGQINDYEWTAFENAISPFDFRINAQVDFVAEVKSTNRSFGRRIHISTAELHEMAYGEQPCHLYRVFELSETAASLRIAEDTRRVALSILESVQGLRSGVRVDSYSLKPCLFSFGHLETIAL